MGGIPEQRMGPYVIFSKVLGLLLGNNGCASTMPLPWPTETTGVVPVGHHNVFVQAFTLI